MIVLNTGWLCTYMYLILILDFFYQKKLWTAALILIICLENIINILNHSVFQVNVSWINPVNIFLMKQCIESLDTRKKKKSLHVFYFNFFYLMHQAFMAHILWYSEIAEEETSQFHSEAQTVTLYLKRICFIKMIFKFLVLWSKHIMQCNTMMSKRLTNKSS